MKTGGVSAFKWLSRTEGVHHSDMLDRGELVLLLPHLGDGQVLGGVLVRYYEVNHLWLNPANTPHFSAPHQHF